MSNMTIDVIYGWVDLKFWHELMPDGRIALGSTAYHYGRDGELQKSTDNVSGYLVDCPVSMVIGNYAYRRGDPQPKRYPAGWSR